MAEVIMSGHTDLKGAERNVALRNKLDFCNGLTGIVEKYERNRKQVKCFFNGIETTKGAMGLMVDLTNVGLMFNIRILVTSSGTEEQNQHDAEEVMKELTKYFA
jgi:hypothetical protein